MIAIIICGCISVAAAVVSFVFSLIERNWTAALWAVSCACWVGVALLGAAKCP